MIDGAWLVLRAAGYVLLLQAAGTALFLAAFGSRLESSVAAIRRASTRVAVAALIVTAAQYFLEAAHMAGEWAGAGDPSLLRLVSASSAGHALALRSAALASLAFGLAGDSIPLRILALIGSVTAVASFLLTGHTSVHAGRALLAPLLFVHLSIVAFWFGSLSPLRRLVAVEPRRAAAGAIDAFSSAAVWLVPAIAVAGVAIATLLLPDFAALRQPYGALLCAKVGLFAALMGVAALNKRRLAPALARDEADAVARFRRSVAVEYALICVTLAATAVMTGLFSPAGRGAAA